MIVPKTFQNAHDFESMILTSILGTLVALKEDLISLKQAESYWLSDLTAKIFEQLRLSEKIIALIEEGIGLKHLEAFPKLYNERLEKLIATSKELINKYYTNYDETNIGILN